MIHLITYLLMVVSPCHFLEEQYQHIAQKNESLATCCLMTQTCLHMLCASLSYTCMLVDMMQKSLYSQASASTCYLLQYGAVVNGPGCPTRDGLSLHLLSCLAEDARL